MISEIKIVYIDDIADLKFSRYIKKNYIKFDYEVDGHKYKKTYKYVKFDPSKGYEELLCNPDVKTANIILVDNHLFEESTSQRSRFSGKQFKILIKKLLPFIEVLIITQDETLQGRNILHKCPDTDINPEDYFKNHEKLDEKLDLLIDNIIEFNDLATDLCNSEDVNKELIDKILDTLDGSSVYENLTKSDIDSLISSFKELKNKIENM